jgi:hypothetical protein
MRHRIQIIDNFLDEPLNYKNSNSSNPTEEISNKIAHSLQANIKISSATPLSQDQIFADYSCDYIAVLYLDFPTECVNKKAVSFWMHKESQDEELPNETKMNWLGIKSIEEIEKCYDVNKKEDWERYMEYFVKYNRLILFDARLFHSYGDESDCRKFLVAINSQ